MSRLPGPFGEPATLGQRAATYAVTLADHDRCLSVPGVG